MTRARGRSVRHEHPVKNWHKRNKTVVRPSARLRYISCGRSPRSKRPIRAQLHGGRLPARADYVPGGRREQANRTRTPYVSATLSVDRPCGTLVRLVFEDNREGFVTELLVRVSDIKNQLDLLVWLQHHIGAIMNNGKFQDVTGPDAAHGGGSPKENGHAKKNSKGGGKPPRSIKWAGEESPSPRSRSPRSPKSPRTASRANSPKSPMHDVATMAKHFFNVADPDKTGFITLRMFEDVFRSCSNTAFGPVGNKATRRRHTELLRRMKRLMVASDCASTAGGLVQFPVTRAAGKPGRCLPMCTSASSRYAKDPKQVQESRRLDLAFQKADVTDLMRAVDVGAKGHVTLADMDNAIASLGDADKAVIDPKYALQPEHVAVLDRLDQFMASKTLRVEDLFNLIDINPAEDVITIAAEIQRGASEGLPTCAQEFCTTCPREGTTG